MNLQGAILVDAGTNQVVLASNSTTAAGESLGVDVNVFVSGSIGTMDGSVRGTTLFGGDEGVDSLSLVFIVTNVERGIYEQLDRSVSLANEKAMSMRNSPYRNVSSLLEYALQCLEEA